MVTVTFAIKPYLARYMYVRYGQSLELLSHNNPPSRLPIPIHLSHLTPIYHFLHQLSVPHPQGASWKETGNITFVLPSPRQGKNPEIYNYFGQDSIFIIEKEIEVEMKAELYSFLLENKFKNGVMYIKSMHEFVLRYDMVESVEEESLMRGFQRWRKKMKKRRYEEIIPYLIAISFNNDRLYNVKKNIRNNRLLLSKNLLLLYLHKNNGSIMEKERYFIHFKGGLYKMLGIAQHSETLEEMVVYQALYGKHEIWVRPKTMFFDKIVRNGIKIDRFKEITEKEIYAYYPERKEISEE